MDEASRRVFSRPAGVDGSFVAEDLRPQKFRDDDAEFSPHDRPSDPVLAEAFGRPYPGGESLQRHPVDAGAMDAEKLGPEAEEPDDPWRDPAAPAALGAPAVAEPAPAPAEGVEGRLGVRDVLFGGRVSYRALAAPGRHRTVDRHARRLGRP